MDSSTFRQLLGRFATGVTVITATDAEGRPHGMTASSLTSVSLAPPLLLVCVDHGASFHPVIERAEAFVVNVLTNHQETVSRRFAGKHEDKFDGIGYRISDHGLVLLDGALAHLECAVERRIPAGDHTIVLGRLVGGDAADGHPLLYYRGGYAELG
ncbi:MAG: flavin reductase family protein [Gemmatimonadales bacterium]|nr:flavin reductase family protein [Gemmatimonadales bacterium]